MYLAHDDTDVFTKVKIYPVWQTLSNIFQERQLQVIQSGTESNVFLRIAAPGVDWTNEYGACTVNLQYGIDDGKIYVETVGEQVAFRSRVFNNVYFHLNWWPVATDKWVTLKKMLAVTMEMEEILWTPTIWKKYVIDH